MLRRTEQAVASLHLLHFTHIDIAQRHAISQLSSHIRSAHSAPARSVGRLAQEALWEASAALHRARVLRSSPPIDLALRQVSKGVQPPSRIHNARHSRPRESFRDQALGERMRSERPKPWSYTSWLQDLGADRAAEQRRDSARRRHNVRRRDPPPPVTATAAAMAGGRKLLQEPLSRKVPLASATEDISQALSRGQLPAVSATCGGRSHSQGLPAPYRQPLEHRMAQVLAGAVMTKRGREPESRKRPVETTMHPRSSFPRAEQRVIDNSRMRPSLSADAAAPSSIPVSVCSMCNQTHTRPDGKQHNSAPCISKAVCRTCRSAARRRLPFSSIRGSQNASHFSRMHIQVVPPPYDSDGNVAWELYLLRAGRQTRSRPVQTEEHMQKLRSSRLFEQARHYLPAGHSFNTWLAEGERNIHSCPG